MSDESHLPPSTPPPTGGYGGFSSRDRGGYGSGGGFGAPSPSGSMPYEPARSFGGPPPMTLAAVRPRFRAFLIDMVTISIVPGVVGGLMLLLGTLTCSQQYDEFGFRAAGCGSGSSSITTLGWAVMVVGWFAAAWFLWVRRVAVGESTIGQRRAGVQVVDAATGDPAIGTGRAWGRLLLRTLLSPLICGLGFFWAIWDGRHQAWHDKIIDTVVISR